jgi:predicted GIY-YIG superfamily endonuclease
MSYFVYVIRSIKYPQTFYVGYTISIKDRLATHNSGGSIHTKKNKPWELVVCMAFKDIDCAKKFEKYLKSQSGRAFAKKRYGMMPLLTYSAIYSSAEVVAIFVKAGAKDTIVSCDQIGFNKTALTVCQELEREDTLFVLQTQ